MFVKVLIVVLVFTFCGNANNIQETTNAAVEVESKEIVESENEIKYSKSLCVIFEISAKEIHIKITDEILKIENEARGDIYKFSEGRNKINETKDNIANLNAITDTEKEIKILLDEYRILSMLEISNYIRYLEYENENYDPPKNLTLEQESEYFENFNSIPEYVELRDIWWESYQQMEEIKEKSEIKIYNINCDNL
tara:strand:+ start:87 stop:674 length:588 start_codon:yes stop_codon:yes gene_type:complete